MVVSFAEIITMGGEAGLGLVESRLFRALGLEIRDLGDTSKSS